MFSWGTWGARGGDEKKAWKAVVEWIDCDKGNCDIDIEVYGVALVVVKSRLERDPVQCADGQVRMCHEDAIQPSTSGNTDSYRYRYRRLHAA
eukprot:8936837-Pyramimonas_sp.AAC.1